MMNTKSSEPTNLTISNQFATLINDDYITNEFQSNYFVYCKTSTLAHFL